MRFGARVIAAVALVIVGAGVVGAADYEAPRSNRQGSPARQADHGPQF